jgi:uncharacterized membrane protein
MATLGGGVLIFGASYAATPRPVLDSAVQVPARLEVRNAQPSWSMFVDPHTVRITSAKEQRVLRVLQDEPLFDGRLVIAQDAQGTVELRVAAKACQPLPSHNAFPYSVRLSIPGRPPQLGCARPVPPLP